jgi:hypothetical protein
VSSLVRVVAPLRDLPRAGTLALLWLVTLGWFVEAPSWNQNSRLALTRAIVEHGTTQIDAYHFTTGDKSRRDGHWYCDKAPGVSLLAVPPYAVFHALRRATGRPPPGVDVVPLDPLDRALERAPAPDALAPGDRLVFDPAHRVALWVCRMASVGVLALVGGAALFLLLLARTGRRDVALAVAATWAFATPALPYGAAFYGHQACAGALVAGFALVALAPDDRSGRGRLAALAGALLGIAVVCEYPAAAPAAAIWAWALARRGPKFAGAMALGAAPLAALLAAYHAAAFGHPLATGYDFVDRPEFAQGMAVAYGLHAPDPRALLELTFGSYRGLFYVAPVSILAVWGLGAALVGDARRDETALAIAIVAYYLGLNAGYYMWDGGAAFGPRHCVPMLPFLALGLAPALEAIPRAYGVLAALSALYMFAAAAAGPEAPQHGDPLWGHALPRLFQSDPPGATDIGRLFGLPGGVGLVLLAAAWAAWMAAGGALRDLRIPRPGLFP